MIFIIKNKYFIVHGLSKKYRHYTHKKNLLHIYVQLKIFKITSFYINTPLLALLPYFPPGSLQPESLSGTVLKLALFPSSRNGVLLNFVSSEGKEKSLTRSGLDYRETEAALPRCASPKTPLCVATCDSAHCRDGESRYRRSPYERVARISLNFFSFMQIDYWYRCSIVRCILIADDTTKQLFTLEAIHTLQRLRGKWACVVCLTSSTSLLMGTLLHPCPWLEKISLNTFWTDHV